MKQDRRISIDASKPYQFIEIRDCGETCCPHCGADGRYIYKWAEYGKERAAMAGCFKALTGHIKMSDVDKYIQRVSEKQAKGKPLNGWDNTVIRMLDYMNKHADDAAKRTWAHGKIWQAVSESIAYKYKRFRC